MGNPEAAEEALAINLKQSSQCIRGTQTLKISRGTLKPPRQKSKLCFLSLEKYVRFNIVAEHAIRFNSLSDNNA